MMMERYQWLQDVDINLQRGSKEKKIFSVGKIPRMAFAIERLVVSIFPPLKFISWNPDPQGEEP